MFRSQSNFLKSPMAGYVFCLFSFLVFQGLLHVVEPIAQREYLAQKTAPELAIFIAPAFADARIWLVVALGVGLLLQRCVDVGQSTFEAPTARAMLALGCFLLVLLRALQLPYCLDDAYIDFRHARNLVLHGSLDYNLGDPAMGFTSHLHLWILSLTGALVGFDALPAWSQKLDIIFDLASFSLVFGLGRRLGLRPITAAFGSLLLALSLFQVRFAISGKESSLLVLLMVILVYAVECQRLGIVAWAAILLFLTRPEGVLVAGAAGGWCLYRHGPRSLKYWIAPVILVAGWYLLLWLHFGTILPQGMVAKALVYRNPLYNTVMALLPIWGYLFGQASLGTLNMQNINILCLILPLTAWALWRNEALRFYLGCLILLTAAFLLKHVDMFQWYFSWYALAPVFVLPFLFEKMLEWAMATGRLPRLLTAGITLFFLLSPLNAYPHSQTKILGAKIPYPIFYDSVSLGRLLRYQSAARQIITQAGTSAYVAVSEDGIFGYTYEGRVLTLDGLAYVPIKRYYPLPDKMYVINFAIAPKLIADAKPDYVVFLDVFASKSLLLDEDFQKSYILFTKFDDRTFGSDYFYIFKKH